MQRILKGTIDQLILLALVIALVGALLSTNFQNLTQFNLGLGVVVIIGLLLAILPKVRTTIAGWLKHLNTIWAAAILIIAYQLTLIFSLSAQFGYDGWVVMQTAMGKANYYYFTVNPNNLGLLSFERGLYLLSHTLGATNFLLVLNFANLILVDVAILLLTLTLRQHLNRKFLWVAVPFCFLLGPWLIVFYTDLAVLPFLAGQLWALHFLITKLTTTSRRSLIGVSIVFGLCTYMAYHLKPSAFILTIAIIIELLIALISNKTIVKNRQLWLSLAIIFVSFGLAIGVNQYWIGHQNLAAVNKNTAMQPTHFLMIGLNPKSGGTFSDEDYRYSLSYHTAASQNRANLARTKQRLADMGPVKVAQFLIGKNYRNTSDGSLGWTNDTQFSKWPSLEHHKFVRSFFYLYGSRRAIYFVAAQLVWVSILIGALFSFLDRSLFARILRLATFGILLFLLIFEGGRSRYLIQALPMIFSLSVIGWTKLKVTLRERQIFSFDWTQFQTTLRRLILGQS